MKRLLLFVLSSAIAVCAFGSRAVTSWETFPQPDGSVLTLTLCGDEHFCYYMDRAGNCYTTDGNGVFHLLSENDLKQSTAMTRSAIHGDFEYKTDWKPKRIYRQMVILVSFADVTFQSEDPQAMYNAMFNEHGYNKYDGAGCIADYFREQSQGRFNVEFDVFGPIQVDAKARYEGSMSAYSGAEVFAEAMDKFFFQNVYHNFSVYDWDGDGRIEQVIIVYAGYSGNQTGKTDYIWPNTRLIDGVETFDRHKIRSYSASGELWSNNASCGIGTICHEYSHCFGLPDIYPTTMSVGYSSVVDQWDLMDNGNITNQGWCPPNYSPLEKMLLGWGKPIELESDAEIEGMKPISEGGPFYRISHTKSEYYLLENRQWSGWDAGVPGQGLLVWHVNYDRDAWYYNRVNNVHGEPNCHLVAADGLSYSDWDWIFKKTGEKNPYQNKSRLMNKCYLSSAPYPWKTDSTDFVNDCLTDTSLPATKLYSKNDSGSDLLSKPIFNIRQDPDGTISFSFRSSNASDGITDVTHQKNHSDVIYDLQGRRIPYSSPSLLSPGLYIINGRKHICP